MKASKFHISTFKEAPADAEIVSHQLMMRAGMIKKLGAGIYNYMPLGLRVIRKIEQIIRAEMDRAQAIELTMPIVQPAELWQESGRFQSMGPELLRIKDRHERDYVIQPTSEEAVTDIARQEIKSYKQLPKNFYQIQTKFRDERRPRFGLMRGREFIMKDAYSFDKDAQSAKESYAVMAQTYRNIFDRFGLKYRAVAADSGAIGGELSEEFQVIAATGEDAIVYCPSSNYAANMEKAQALPPKGPRATPKREMTKVHTPEQSTCEAVCKLLGEPLEHSVKSLVLATDHANAAQAQQQATLWLILLRGDRELNEVKLGKLPDFAGGFRFASAAEIQNHFSCKSGFLGPVGVSNAVRVIADLEVSLMGDWICGANEEGYHLSGVNWGRDVHEPYLVADIRNVAAGDLSPDAMGTLSIERGIEVGHVFYLGTKYSQALNATFLDERGKPQLMQMGCYGIGVTRVAAAAIEQNHDERGMIWPDTIAPFTVVICPIGMDKNEEVCGVATQLYTALCERGVDVILDDRAERPGVMFAEWELIGVPHRVVLSERSLKEGVMEYQHRRQTTAIKIEIPKVVEYLLAQLSSFA